MRIIWTFNIFENRQNEDYLEFQSLLFLMQTISKIGISDSSEFRGDRLQLHVISNNIQEVNGNEKISPEKATILGLCKVLPQEYPHITCRCIDIVFKNNQDGEEGNYKNIIDQLFSELTNVSSDLVVAYRGCFRWVQTFEPVCLESVVEEKIPLRKQGVYLFSGGLETIEVVLAEYLVKSLQAKLIFIENSAFPEKDKYSRWLETHTSENEVSRKIQKLQALSDEVSRKIQKLQALSELGAEILVLRADRTNYEQMYQSLRPENIGQIHGVIYSTGIQRENIFNSIPEIGKIELGNLFNSQHRQITVLEQVLKNRKLVPF